MQFSENNLLNTSITYNLLSILKIMYTDSKNKRKNIIQNKYIPYTIQNSKTYYKCKYVLIQIKLYN